MVNSVRLHWLCKFFSIAIFFLALTGCPGSGDRLEPDEEGYVSINNENICFSVTDSDDYVLQYISINPRGTKLRDERIIFNPSLKIVNELLCIPSSTYPFDKDGQYFIRASFTSLKHASHPRRIVSALDVSRGWVHNIRPNDMGILRPYNEMIES